MALMKQIGHPEEHTSIAMCVSVESVIPVDRKEEDNS